MIKRFITGAVALSAGAQAGLYNFAQSDTQPLGGLGFAYFMWGLIFTAAGIGGALLALFWPSRVKEGWW